MSSPSSPSKANRLIMTPVQLSEDAKKEKYKKLLLSDPEAAEKIGRCPFCLERLKIGAETIDERSCDNCGRFSDRLRKKINPEWWAMLEKRQPQWFKNKKARIIVARTLTSIAKKLIKA